MRVNKLDVDDALTLGLITVTKVYLDSIPVLVRAADTEAREVVIVDSDGNYNLHTGRVEIYVPNDEQRFPGIKELEAYAPDSK